MCVCVSVHMYTCVCSCVYSCVKVCVCVTHIASVSLFIIFALYIMSY